MRKLLAVATLSLLTLGMAVPAIASEASDNWYQLKIDAQVNQCQSQFSAIKASRGEEAQLTAIADESEPNAMAADVGGPDLYSQTLAAQSYANRLAEAAIRQ